MVTLMSHIWDIQTTMLKMFLFQNFQHQRGICMKWALFWKKFSTLAKTRFFHVSGVFRYQNVKIGCKHHYITSWNDILGKVPFWCFKHQNAIVAIVSHIWEIQATMLKTFLFQCFQHQRGICMKWSLFGKKFSTLEKTWFLYVLGVVRNQKVKMPANTT